MDISIIQNFPLGIKEQIKRQIKTMIAENELMPGDTLLSAKDMGLLLTQLSGLNFPN